MSSTEVIVKTPRELDPKRDWNEYAVRQRMRKWFVVLATAVGVISLGLIGWVLFVAPITKAEVTPLAVGADLTLVLAPILAAAAGVERLLETIFNVLEGAWRTMVAYLGYGMRWLKSAEGEVEQARQWLSNTTGLYTSTLRSYNEKMDAFLKEINASNTPVADLPEDVRKTLDGMTAEATKRTDDAKRLLEEAERRLADAEGKLAGVTSSADYISAKTAASIILGLMFGVIVAAVGQLQMFALLGIKAVPERIDVLITGLVIGSGSNPVHSLIGILQQGKDALDSVQSYLSQANRVKQEVADQIAKALPPRN
ncbi:MAG: hypothetical protein U0559_21525 [Anaerolineae bacterium]